MTSDVGEDERGHIGTPDGGTIAYQVHARWHGGTPLLLIRPLGGSMALWGAFRTALAESVTVLSFDLRGTGHSSHDPGWVTTLGLAQDSLRVLNHLGVRRAHIFGISLGGMIATELAALAPGRIARLCIASAPIRGLELTRTGLTREVTLALCFARARKDVESGLVTRILSERFRHDHAEEVARIVGLLHAAPATRRALLKHSLASLLHDARLGVHRIQAQTLVLAGEEDALLGTLAPRALAESIPHAHFGIVKECGHDLTLEKPLVTAARVAQFLGA